MCANAVGKICKLTDSEAEDEHAELDSAPKAAAFEPAGCSESVDVGQAQTPAWEIESSGEVEKRGLLQITHGLGAEPEQKAGDGEQAASAVAVAHPDNSRCSPTSYEGEENEAGQETVAQKQNPFGIRAASPTRRLGTRSDVSDSALEKQLALLQEVGASARANVCLVDLTD